MNTFYLITEPGENSLMVDVLSRVTAAEFAAQVRGGLSEADRPELHATLDAAMLDLSQRNPYGGRLVDVAIAAGSWKQGPPATAADAVRYFRDLAAGSGA